MTLMMDERGTCVIGRIPCAFAPPTKRGERGTHYVAVQLGANSSIRNVWCECQALHGEGIQAMHEMGDGSDTCYAGVEAFNFILRTLRNPEIGYIDFAEHIKKSVELFAVGSENPYSVLHQALAQAGFGAQKVRYDRINSRVNLNTLPVSRHLFKHQQMTKVANQVAAQLCKHDVLVDRGVNHHEVQNHVVAEKVYPKAFIIEERYIYKVFIANNRHLFPNVDESEDTLATVAKFERPLHGSRDIIGVRTPEGKWNVDTDLIRAWAADHTSLVGGPRDVGHCYFCESSFDRMSKHISGAKHGERVLEVTKLALKATSRMGLQMINNPRHRSVFFKDAK